ncbi:(R)-mandelonitrile lyase [Amycolatopsis sp. CA-230715]|uniref:(R)-mandelonitrile lyase n=1 Tax=Amycolatopsis sp. CA-230715 TaxID=2745196 RepID=UPI001C037828|nr:cupin domain-containing protein [Amycolatopsis sp. CA-230715]QWF83231.1 hypothetical protein HUW46_06671 [Amycolatopsis sp. CA-230715]
MYTAGVRILTTVTAAPAPDEWITGDAWIEPIASAESPSRAQIDRVTFAAGARTAWHRHPLGQTLVVIDGTGLVQRRGGPVEAIRVGDAVRIEPGEWHWHGAAPGTAMTHLAIEELPEDGSAAELGDPVTEAEYRSGEHSAETPITRTVLLDQSLAAPQELHGVEIRRITIAPGCAAGLHVHNTPVFGNIERGSVIYQIEGEAPAALGPGDVFYEPKDVRIARFDAQDDGVTFLGYFLLNAGQTAEIEFPTT